MPKQKIEKAYPEAYRLAHKFHEFYEISAPAFGYEIKKETKEFDPESPNGRLMAYVCYEIVKEGIEQERLRIKASIEKVDLMEFRKKHKDIDNRTFLLTQKEILNRI